MTVLLLEPQLLTLASQLYSLRLLPVIYYWPAVRQPPTRLLPGTYIWLHLCTVTCFSSAPGMICVFSLLCFSASVPRLQPDLFCRIIWESQQSPSPGLHRSQPGLILSESLLDTSGFHMVFIAGFGIRVIWLSLSEFPTFYFQARSLLYMLILEKSLMVFVKVLVWVVLTLPLDLLSVGYCWSIVSQKRCNTTEVFAVCCVLIWDKEPSGHPASPCPLQPAF